MNNNNNKTLARAYKSLLEKVPQSPIHHPEGNVLTHVRMVRKSIHPAIKLLRDLQLQDGYDFLSGVNFTFSERELNVLKMAAWLHDIGKVTATFTKNDRIVSYGHDLSYHYRPLIHDLLNISPEKIAQFYRDNRSLICFLVRNHMGFFGKEFIKNNFTNGVVNNTQKIVLLVVLVYADNLGRHSSVVESGLERTREKFQKFAETSRKNSAKQNTRITVDIPQDLVTFLREKQVRASKIAGALRGKFPALTDEQITELLNE